ncbi:MAG: lipopolysaccharide biosynthesis protein [Flavobacteriales bacterium]|nr:lipopolysaccharide biosynthesis protein [Flavobacteriales bacterium]MBP6698119.1 lipopolysaccharide biosynthesis protein [Flavobacteriales bacterium]
MRSIRQALQSIRHDLDRLRTPGSFTRNSFHFLSGNALGMLSQVVLTPIIARIYGPEAYGMFGLYLALVMNSASVSDLGFSAAYVLPKEEEKFLQLVRFNLLLTGVVSLCCLLIAICSGPLYAVFPDLAVLGDWIYLVAPVSACYALSIIATQWLARAKKFKESAFTGVSMDVGTRLFNVAFGLGSKGMPYGLMLGDALVRGAAIPFYARWLRPVGLDSLRTGWTWMSIRATVMEYRRYPLWIFPERWVSLLGIQLPLFFLASDLAAVGHFALGAALLLIPLRLLGFSFGPVYMQKAAETVHAAPEELKRVTRGLFTRLLWVGLSPFLLMTFFADHGFALVFGEPWRDAGFATACLGPSFLFRLVTEPLVSIFNVRRKEHFMLVFQIVLNVFRTAAMGLVLYLGWGTDAVLIAYGLWSLLGSMVLSAFVLNAARLNGRAMTMRAVSLVLVASALFAAIRFALFGSWVPLPG